MKKDLRGCFFSPEEVTLNPALATLLRKLKYAKLIRFTMLGRGPALTSADPARCQAGKLIGMPGIRG